MKQDKGWNRSTKCLLAAALLALAMAGPSCVFGTETVECSSGIRCPTTAQCSADGTACITDACGNGELDTGEICDDGNVENGDECSADCKTSRNCGNFVEDLGEVCDDGNNVSGDGCRSDCLSDERCGNGLPDVDEACDDGNTVAGDNCSPDCKLESCGDMVKDPGEECDDGNLVSGDGCREDCLSDETCGNGRLDRENPRGELPEECDDGENGSASCTRTCKIVRCGDEEVNGMEECDDGPQGSANCNINCTFPTCGDGIANVQAPNDAPSNPGGLEICDSGGVDTVNCDFDCTLPFCGDRHVNEQADNTGTPTILGDTEDCDTGAVNTADCNAICTFSRCGDGFANGADDEECDERNPDENAGEGVDSEVCDRDCTLPTCEDGVFNPLAEPCESFGVDSARCDIDCSLIACGDGHVNLAAAELCDATAVSPTCDADCTLARCGDGIVNVGSGEACDSGGVNTLDCNFDCTLPVCGDGILNREFNEECDDKNTVNDVCRDTCRRRTTGAANISKCGDGDMDLNNLNDRFEQCDDGVDGDADLCKDDCSFGPQTILGDGQRQGEECEPALDGPFSCDANGTFRICGDGFINRAAGEQCDDGNIILGDGCDACVLTTCGDRVRGPYEQCDDGNHVPGDGCSADCQKECGNGRVDAGEHCDDGNLIANDACTNDCTFGSAVVLDDDIRQGQECVLLLDGLNACDVDHTFATCGDGFLNVAFEECDDGNELSGDGCSATCQGECGNDILDRFEQCDAGIDNRDDSASLCTTACKFGPAVDLENDEQEGEECVPAVHGANACDDDHTFADCGDGTLNTAAGEGCDDGNSFAGDRCSADCQLELCGNGLIEGTEQCDNAGGPVLICNINCTFGASVLRGDGIRQGQECEPSRGDVCDPDFTFVRCGDRFLNIAAGEECDDGNDAPGDGCSPACVLEDCGNGFRDDPREQCDDGNRDPGDTCGPICLREECGNGFPDPNEQCDDGAGNSDTRPNACRTSCLVAFCGDRVIDTGETCDDGNIANGDGCDASCQTEPPPAP